MRLEQDLRPSWKDWSHGNTQPSARIQRRIKSDGGLLTEFCFQLEYNTAATQRHDRGPRYVQVARFDHDINGPHDVRYEGLHMDLYAEGHKVAIRHNFPELGLREAAGHAEGYLKLNHQRLLAEYEQRCEIPADERIYDAID